MRYDDGLRALVEFAASRHNAFTTAEAADHGVPAHRLRRGAERGTFLRLHPKVWSVASLPPSPMQRLRAVVLTHPGSAATSTSAAWLHGWLDDPPSRDRLWFPTRHSRPASPAILQRWVRIDPAVDVTTVDGIRTLSRAAALCSLGPNVDPDTLERCLDAYLRTSSERWLDDTMRRLGSHRPGGVRALERLQASPHRAAGLTESHFERLVARLVAVPGLPPLELQHPVVLDGRRYRIDVAIPELRLGVEAHSRTFHWGVQAEDADNVRDLALAAAGWQLLYATWRQVQEPDVFAARFAAAARARAAMVGVDPS